LIDASGDMEAGFALDMVINLYNKSENRLFIEYLVSDDDSIMRSHLRHIENGGKIAENVPDSTFLTDTSHRIKHMCSPIFERFCKMC